MIERHLMRSLSSRESSGYAAKRGFLGQMCNYMCHSLYITGHPTEALAFGRSAQTIAEALTDVPLQVGAHLHFGLACLVTGRYRRAEDLHRKVLQLLEGDLRWRRLLHVPAVMVRGSLTWALADRGEFDEGIVHGKEGLRLGKSLEHP